MGIFCSFVFPLVSLPSNTICWQKADKTHPSQTLTSNHAHAIVPGQQTPAQRPKGKSFRPPARRDLSVRTRSLVCMAEVGVFAFVNRAIVELRGAIRIGDRRIAPKSTPFDALLALRSNAVFGSLLHSHRNDAAAIMADLSIRFLSSFMNLE